MTRLHALPRLAAFALALWCASACAAGAPSATSSTASTASSLSTGTSSTAPSSTTAAAPGPLRLAATTIATGLVVPWALDFAPDGTMWFTERPGRVRLVRGGQLLPAPAATINAVNAPGCEDGLLGLAVRVPYVFVYYTYSGASGNTNRVSRFTISGDHLVAERVILDGIPGGQCYHFGGRIRFGPDGRLYVTTGEGFVASRAASPSGLSGKILSVNPDGTGLTVFAWGFRNPQGLAFDPQGRLYASNNGPTGDLGLCCHDEIAFVQQGHFYGWPAWAANTPTSYPASGLPARTPPILESDDTVWAPSGMTFYTPRQGEQPTLLVAELKGARLMRIVIDPNDPSRVVRTETVFSGAGRLRDAEPGPDGCLYVLTSNRDGRGSPSASDDRLLKLCPS